MMVDPDDIIRALREGATWAEPAMVTIVGPVLLGYAESVGRDLSSADREKAVEAAVTKAVAKIEAFDSRRGTFTGWLRPFVRHAINDIRRQQGRTPELLPEELELPPPEPEDPTKAAEAQAMTAALAELRDTDRLIIILRDYEHLDYAACAERIGNVSDAACRVRHFRALRRLADELRSQPALKHYFEKEET